MKSTLVVSERGQITLPAPLRKRMGIKNGGVVRVEERDGRVVLSPAAVVEVEMYSDEKVKSLLEQDRISKEDRRRTLAKFTRRKH